jgi:hypothetical protein
LKLEQRHEQNACNLQHILDELAAAEAIADWRSRGVAQAVTQPAQAVAAAVSQRVWSGLCGTATTSVCCRRHVAL